MLPALAALAIAGTALSAYGQNKASKAEKKEAYRYAAQIRRNAGAQYASDQLQAAEYTREGERVVSNARASIAAGGGVTTDAGSIDILSKIDREATYNRLAALYDARNNYEGNLAKADAVRREGKNARTAAKYQIGATVLKGAGSAFASYGGGA